jgi:4-amino-4-deoxy-L-arabinose transferase-like glycosyltransferase
MKATPAQAVLAAALTALLYIPGLAFSPPHLLHDEIKFALQAESIAETGRDLNGRLLAVYFPEPGYSVGRDPVCIYVTAGVLAWLPLSEASIRLPSALVGALGVGLIFALARSLFARAATAWIVAAILALTPTYFIHSRLALSVIYPVPFVVLWLIALRRYLAAPHATTGAICGAILGLGVYSYLGSVLMMPLYLAVTVVVLASRRDWRAAALPVASFAVVLIPIVLWQIVQPDRYTDIVSAYHLLEGRRGPGPSLVDAVATAIGPRADTYWQTFDPGRLFFTGDSSLHISTREVGTFLLPVAALLAIGIVALVQEGPSAIGAVLLVGLVSAPLPAVIMADVEVRRWLVVTPFVAIIAGYGVERLWQSGVASRTACVLLLAAMPWQFALFARDYFGPYRERASFWFGGNIRAAFEATLDDIGAGSPPTVYISGDIPWVEAYWRFYVTARHQHGLIAHAQYLRFETDPVPAAVPGAFAVVPAQNTAAVQALERAGWVPRHRIPDLDGKPSFVIYGPSRV